MAEHADRGSYGRPRFNTQNDLEATGIAEEETTETPKTGDEEKEARLADQLTSEGKRIAELTDDLQRLQAEFDNHKKRTERQWAERTALATQRMMTELLPVLDSFDKALEEATAGGSTELRNGLEGIHRQLVQVLEREGLKEITPVEKFDPFLHEALIREEREDVDDGIILEVLQKGYSLGPKVLRPTRVKVAKRTAEETPAEDQTAKIHDQEPDERSDDMENHSQ